MKTKAFLVRPHNIEIQMSWTSTRLDTEMTAFGSLQSSEQKTEEQQQSLVESVVMKKRTWGLLQVTFYSFKAMVFYSKTTLPQFSSTY